MRLIRVLRRWLPPVRRRTVLAGIALGALLPPVLILAGTIGISPLPDQPRSPRRDPEASGGALSATQREVRRSLLSPSDLPPGYRPVAGSPSATPTGAVVGGQAEHPAGTPPAAPAQGPLEFLPELPGLGLDPDDGEPPDGQPEHGHPPGDGPPGDGPPGDGPPNGGPPDDEAPGTPTPGASDAPPPGGPTPDGEDPDGPVPASPGGDGSQGAGDGRDPAPPEHAGVQPVLVRHGAASIRRLGIPDRADSPDRCRDLIVAPWRLVAGYDPVAPQRAEFVDRRRGVRVWQALGALSASSAQRAVELIRQTAAGCARFHTALPRDRRDAGSGARAAGRLTVTIDAARAAYPMRFTAVTGDGRAWTGYLAVDRVGPVLSMLSHVGPRRAVTRAEASADRRTALDKARPLARRLA